MFFFFFRFVAVNSNQQIAVQCMHAIVDALYGFSRDEFSAQRKLTAVAVCMFGVFFCVVVDDFYLFLLFVIRLVCVCVCESKRLLWHLHRKTLI